MNFPTAPLVLASMRHLVLPSLTPACADPSRSLVSAIAERLGAVTVGEPYRDGTAGVMGMTGLVMVDRDGFVWGVLLDQGQVGVGQDEWNRLGERLVRAHRLPWRWLPGHRRSVEALARLRSLVLKGQTPAAHEGTLVESIVALSAQDADMAAQDLRHRLRLWESARLAEGHTPESARTMLGLLLPTLTLSRPAVAEWMTSREEA